MTGLVPVLRVLKVEPPRASGIWILLEELVVVAHMCPLLELVALMEDVLATGADLLLIC